MSWSFRFDTFVWFEMMGLKVGIGMAGWAMTVALAMMDLVAQ